MSVTSVEELEDAEGGWNKLWQRTYTRNYKVECSSRDDTEVTIRTATTTVLVMGVPTVVPWLPRMGSPFVGGGAVIDSGAFLMDVKYKRTHGGPNPEGSTWVVTMEFGPYDGSVFGMTPTGWPLKLSFGAQKFERVCAFDVSNNPIVNSAGSPFGDPVTADDTRRIITVVRNEAMLTAGSVPGFDLTLAATYSDTVNNATWNGFAAKWVKCTSITTPDPQQDSNSLLWYYEVTYVFEINRDTWTKKVLDQGYQSLDGSGKAVPVANDGVQVDDPVPLDGSGHVLGSGASPVFLSFEVYPAVDFTPLNIAFTAALGET